MTQAERSEPLKLLLNMTILDMELFQRVTQELPAESWNPLLEAHAGFDQTGQYIVCRSVTNSDMDAK